jgi:hypothetical protein
VDYFHQGKFYLNWDEDSYLLKLRLGEVNGFHMENHAHVVDNEDMFFVGDVRGNENPGKI